MPSPPDMPNFDLNETDFLLEIRPAIRDFEVQIRRGEEVTSETLIARFPQLFQEKEAWLEVIYTEFVVRQELGQSVSREAWIKRFPQWQADLDELFQVHELLSENAPIDVNTATALGCFLDVTRIGSMSKSRLENQIGDYDVIREIGSGSMGTVYLARQRKLDRIVALKTVNEWGSGSLQVLERFRIEAEASARLQHPNIVQIYEVGVDHHVPYFSMEYVAGGNLATAIHHRAIEAKIAARVIECLAQAVHYAHLQGIVHRDLKPANILLSPSDRPAAIPLELPNDRDPTTKTTLGYEPKLSDFGLAKRIDMNDQKTLPGHAIGTPSYMAPEQTGDSSLPTGTSCDVYSLGAVLYDMLTGRPPFNAPTVAETLSKVLHEDPISLCSLQASVPRDLETICLKCLQKDPIRRYSSAKELAEDLQRFLSGRPIHARPAGAIERIAKSVKRHPLISVFCLTLAIGMAAFAWQWLRAESHRIDAELQRENAIRQAQKADAARASEFDERQRLERVLYAHDISLSKLEFLSNRTTRSRDLLEKCPPELNQWEWRFLQSTSKQELCDFDDLKSPAWAVAMSPDGTLVAASTAAWGIDRPSEIRVWNIDKQQVVWTLHGHSSSIMDIEFSPDGKQLVSIGTQWRRGGAPGQIRLWDLTSGATIWSNSAVDGHSVTFSPDGKQVAVGITQGTIDFYQAANGESLGKLSGHTGYVFDLSFSPDGHYLASAGRDGTARIWQAEGLKQVAIVSGLGDVRRIAYSPTGRDIAVGTYSGMVVLFTQQGDSLIESVRFHEQRRIGALRYTPDGQALAISAVNQSLKFVDPNGLRVIREIHGHNGDILDVAFDRGGIRMATTGPDGRVRVRDMSALEQPILTELPGPHFSDALAPKGGTQLVLAMTQNSNRPARADYSAKIWDTQIQKYTVNYHGHTDWLTSLAIDPNEQWLATGSKDRTVRVYEKNSGKHLRSLIGHVGEVLDIATLNNGKNLASVASDRTLRLWNLNDGDQLGEWRIDHDVGCLAATLDKNLMATGGTEGTIEVWREDSKVSLIRCQGSLSRISKLAFSPDGSMLAAANDLATIELWRVAELIAGKATQPFAVLRGHTEGVSSIAFAPDGQRIVSCSSDRTIKLWDLVSNEEVLSLTADTSATSSILFSPDGASIFCINQVQIWQWQSEPARSLNSKIEVENQKLAWDRHELRSAIRLNHHYAVVMHSGALLSANVSESERRSLLRSRASALRALGKYEQAIADYEAIAESSDLNEMGNLALLYLLIGNVDGYNSVCQIMMKRIHVPANVNTIAWAAVMHRESLVKYPELFDKAVEALSGTNISSLNTLGAVYFRANKPELAIATLEESVQLRGRAHPHDWLFLALAHHAMGHNEEAKQFLGKAHEWHDKQLFNLSIRQPVDPLYSQSIRLELDLLLGEADDLIK